MTFRNAMVSLLLALWGVTTGFAAAGAPPSVSPPPATPIVGMANPASVNCLKQGGTLQLRQDARGSYGLCVFKGGRECEEWALFRGECPVGGLPPQGRGKDTRQGDKR